MFEKAIKISTWQMSVNNSALFVPMNKYALSEKFSNKKYCLMSSLREDEDTSGFVDYSWQSWPLVS